MRVPLRPYDQEALMSHFLPGHTRAALATCLVALLAIAATAAPAGAAGTGRTLTTALTGAAEVPGQSRDAGE